MRRQYFPPKGAYSHGLHGSTSPELTDWNRGGMPVSGKERTVSGKWGTQRRVFCRHDSLCADVHVDCQYSTLAFESEKPLLPNMHTQQHLPGETPWAALTELLLLHLPTCSHRDWRRGAVSGKGREGARRMAWVAKDRGRGAGRRLAARWAGGTLRADSGAGPPGAGSASIISGARLPPPHPPLRPLLRMPDVFGVLLVFYFF